MKKCLIPCAFLIACWVEIPAPCSAQEGVEALEEARALFKEIAGLRQQMEKAMMEISALDGEVQGATTERQQEIQSERMLKNRTMERLSEVIQEKQKTLFERATALIARDTESVELRRMRFEAAFTLNRYDIVLEDTGRLPDREKDLDILMIRAQALNSLYRFDEALRCFEKAIKLLERDRRSYVRYQMGVCSFNAHQFQKAFDTFNELLNEAPPAERQRFDLFVRNAAQYVKYWETEQALRKAEAEAGTNPLVAMETEKGAIQLELFEDQAPNTVANFISLAESGFYDALNFHRVIPQFMAQGGCPDGTGSGGPGYQFADECRQADARKHFVGSLSMANSGPNTNGSQFFITTVVTWHLNGKHTVFGRVLDGQDVVNRLEGGERILSVKVLRKRDHAYVVKKL